MSRFDPDMLEENDRQSIQAFEDMAHERAFFQDSIESSIMEAYNESDKDFSDESFHSAIWKASTEILNGLEVQVVVDTKNELYISYGTAGFVDFKTIPEGMKLPVKCWIHTHPFGAAYFSGTDWRTVNIWQPLMKEAYVLGGEDHFGHWNNEEPNVLCIHKDGLYTFQHQQKGDEEE